MTPLRQRMIEDMQLRGLSEITQDRYVRAVRQLAEHYGKSPDKIAEEELRRYFLYLKNDKKAARSTCTVALCGIKFFYEHTLKREWPTLTMIRPPKEHKLPVVLSVEEVQQLLGCLRLPHYRVCLTTIYACGLRVSEGVKLQVTQIDGARCCCTCGREKEPKIAVPLSPHILEMLRNIGLGHSSSPRVVISNSGSARQRFTSYSRGTPMTVRSVQRALKAALKESGLFETCYRSYPEAQLGQSHLLEAWSRFARHSSLSWP